MRWITLGLGATLGYLLGSAEGRQNLEKMTQNAQKLWNDPKTQEKVSQVQEQAQQKFAEVKDSDPVQKATAKVEEAASQAQDAVKGADSKDQDSSAVPRRGDTSTGEGKNDDAVPGPASNDDSVSAANATGADPDIISDPSTPLGAEGPAHH